MPTKKSSAALERLAAREHPNLAGIVLSLATKAGEDHRTAFPADAKAAR